MNSLILISTPNPESFKELFLASFVFSSLISVKLLTTKNIGL